MKNIYKYLFLFSISSLTLSAWAGCDVNGISVVRESGFSISIGGGKSDSNASQRNTVNIPLVINGKKACYHQSNGLSIKTERKKENEFVEFELTPLEAEFENVPESGVYQYLNIEYDDRNSASQVHMVTFLCSGETPIGSESFSDRLTKLAFTNNVNVNTTSMIATGRAAEILNQREGKKANTKVYDHFLDLYRERSKDDSIYSSNSDIFIPGVIARSSVESRSSLKREMYSSYFSRTLSSVNGCSKKFQNSMSEFLLENVVKNSPFKGIAVKKKTFSSKYKMKWTL